MTDIEIVRPARAPVSRETNATDPPARIERIGRDPAALEALYRAHFDDVVAYFARRVNSPHDVADLVAETFVRAVAGAARYDPGAGAPVAWLFGIARNVQFEYWRTGRTQHDTARRLSGRRLLDDEDVTRLEERIDAERLARELRGDLHGLPDRQRELVELVDLVGLTPSEAAAALNITAGTARIRLHRARKTLRTGYERREH